MRLLALWSLFSTIASVTAVELPHRDYDLRDYYAIHLDPSTDPSHLASELNLSHEGLVGEIKDHHVFSSPKKSHNVVDGAIQELKRRRRKRTDVAERHVLDGVLWNQKQQLRQRLFKRTIPCGGPTVERRDEPAPSTGEIALAFLDKLADDLHIKDPIFKEQWHLFNPRELGHDVNVSAVWRAGVTGGNATVAIIDDGLDMYSGDLKDNYFAEGSYDFNDKGPEPRPRLSDDRHGTRCAGEVAAVRNDVCGIGVAYDSKVAGIRILSKPIDDLDEAVAMNYAYQKNNIYSCSWGPPDDGRSMDAPGILIKKAMVSAVQAGRHGLGNIFVFASGNGAANDDNCNFDGYTNSIYSITVGAIDRKGLHPYYSEKCSAQLVVTYSSGSGDAIHTTDVSENGVDHCYDGHSGTSAAAPLAAGIFALALSARPDLTWRDMQYLVVDTAVPVNEDTGEYQTTTIGKKFSHTFGYGKVDAWALVEAAKTWKSVKRQAWFSSPWVRVNANIPEGDAGFSSGFGINQDALNRGNLARLEHVTVTMNVEHTRRGDLSVELHSPSGIVSYLSATRRHDDAVVGYVDWTFMSVAHWGENGKGIWTIIVKDTQRNGHVGKFIDWKLTLWGEAIKPEIQPLLPMPTEHDDDHNDNAGGPPVANPSPAVPLPTLPSDHPTRPVNQKPTSSSSAAASPTASADNDSYLPSFFPTFGVSARTQIWIYGALSLILIFVAGLALYFFIARRKRLRANPRDDYEFAMLDDQEDDDARVGLRGGTVGRKNKRRAGELYDAFAAGSDEELFSDDEEEEEGERDEDEKGSYRDDKGDEDEEDGEGRRDEHEDDRRELLAGMG